MENKRVFMKDEIKTFVSSPNEGSDSLDKRVNQFIKDKEFVDLKVSLVDFGNRMVMNYVVVYKTKAIYGDQEDEKTDGIFSS